MVGLDKMFLCLESFKPHLLHSELEQEQLDKLGHRHLAKTVDGEHHADGKASLLVEPRVHGEENVDVDQPEGGADEETNADHKVECGGGKSGEKKAKDENHIAEDCYKSITSQLCQRSNKEGGYAPGRKKH